MVNIRNAAFAIALALFVNTSCGGGNKTENDERPSDRDADVGTADVTSVCDNDGDGYIDDFLRFDPRCSSGGEVFDCDDDNDAIFPGAEEVCDRVDNDCDGEIDDAEIHSCPLSCHKPSSGCETVRKLVSGDDHFCALLSSGDVLCWGSNTSGEVADFEQAFFPRPRRLKGISGVRDIDIGTDLSCALIEERAICWGGGVAVPYAVTVGVNVVQIAVDDTRLCSLTTSGTVICSSRDQSGFVTSSLKVYVESGAMAVSTYDDHLCALMAIGEVRCWNGDTSYIPILSEATAIDIGPDLGCAVVAGTVSCWEPGEYATQIEDITDAVDIRLGRNVRCALQSDQTLDCFEGSAPDSLGTVEAFTLADNSGVVARPSGELISFVDTNTERLSVGLDSERLPILFTDETQGRCLDHGDITTLATDGYALMRQREHIEGSVETTSLSVLCDDCFNTFAQCVLKNPSDSAECYTERSACIGLPIDFLFPATLAENLSCGQDQCLDRASVGSACNTSMDCRSNNCASVPFLDLQETSARICRLP
jgi:hypothetical protein